MPPMNRPPAQIPGKPYKPSSPQMAAAAAIATVLAISWEGRTYYAYDDFRPKHRLVASDKIMGTLTVCTGHTDAGGGPKIDIGHKYTPAECDAYLALDRKTAVATVVKITPELYANPSTAAAAEDFAFNAGPANYAKSSMVVDFKAGRIEAGCKRLLDWSYSRGKFLQGLLNRRKVEMAACLAGIK